MVVVRSYDAPLIPKALIYFNENLGDQRFIFILKLS